MEQNKTAINLGTIDLKEFEAIFKSYYSALCYTAYKVLNDKESAEDVVQDLFMHLWNNRATTIIESNLSSYLLTSVRNRAIRKKQQNRLQVRQIDETNDHKIAGDNSTDDEMQSLELQVHIKKAIDSLPPKCREVFMLSRFENKKYKEIAEDLDISVKTVENQMGKALKMIREYLEINYSNNPMVLFLLLNLKIFKHK